MARSTLSWELHRIERGLGPHRDQWDALNARLFAGNPYFESLFVEPLLKHFAAGTERLCVHRRDGEIDAMLIVTPSRLGKWSLFVPAQAQIAPILTADAKVLSTLFGRLSWLTPGLECPCQDPENSPLRAPESGSSAGVTERARTISVRLDSSFEEYWKARSAHVRKSIGRRTRRVKDAGMTMRLEHLSDVEAMRGAVERFGALESSGWKAAGGTAVSIENTQGRFYAEVMAGFAGQGRASVYELYFDDALVAVQLAVASNQALVLLKTTYDEQQANHAPGRLLLHGLLEREFERKRVAAIEFYTNASSDQAAWATHERRISDHMLFRNAGARFAYRVAQRIRR